MNESGFDPEIRDWVRLADERLAVLVSLMKPIVCFEGFSEEQLQTVSWLSSASVRASGSALLLIGFEKIWDAEILSRSVFEGTLKFCHLLSEPSKFADRCQEFETALPDINSLADHDRPRSAPPTVLLACCLRASFGAPILVAHYRCNLRDVEYGMRPTAVLAGSSTSLDLR